VDETAQELVLAGADSAVALVADGDRVSVAAAGEGARPDARFRIGSVTKTFTATLVLQLAEEGKLGLDDPVARYLPGLVPAGRRISIRHLLQHRSGLVDVTSYASWIQAAYRSRAVRPRDAVRFALDRDPLFPAGSSWSYSNTNYLVLGLLVEAVTGKTYGDELSRRILQPLELEHTALPRTRRVPGLDDEGVNPNVPWAAGILVSDARDLARFASALLAGELLSRRWLAAMKLTGGADSGLGIFPLRLPCGTFWGHAGGILDYGTQVFASADGRRVAVLAVRGSPDVPPDEPLASLLCPDGEVTSAG
jgi:D-alanyl-D-alanine carboxypeptidase